MFTINIVYDDLVFKKNVSSGNVLNTDNTYRLIIIATNYNILRIIGGIAGTAYKY